jgi:hypothetical protein
MLGEVAEEMRLEKDFRPRVGEKPTARALNIADRPDRGGLAMELRAAAAISCGPSGVAAPVNSIVGSLLGWLRRVPSFRGDPQGRTRNP